MIQLLQMVECGESVQLSIVLLKTADSVQKHGQHAGSFSVQWVSGQYDVIAAYLAESRTGNCTFSGQHDYNQCAGSVHSVANSADQPQPIADSVSRDFESTFGPLRIRSPPILLSSTSFRSDVT